MKKKLKTTAEIFQSERKSWGEINPVTKVIPNKKHYKRKSKYKNYDSQT